MIARLHEPRTRTGLVLTRARFAERAGSVAGMAATPRTLGDPALVDEVIDRLRTVIDPELGHDIVELGMVNAVEIDATGVARVSVALTTPSCPLRSQIEDDTARAVPQVPF